MAAHLPAELEGVHTLSPPLRLADLPSLWGTALISSWGACPLESLCPAFLLPALLDPLLPALQVSRLNSTLQP